MTITRLSWQNLTSNPLNTLLSLLLMTFGIGIISLLLLLNNEVEQQLEGNLKGIDMVVGAKGSPLQLILSSIYHVDNPTGNIPYNEANKLKKNPMVELTIPLSYGDSYNGYRIVGTTHDYPQLYELSLKEGRLWAQTLEVVLGSTVAQMNQLNLGDTFYGTHGLIEGGHVHDDYAYEVVGILNSSKSIIDQLILTNTQSVWKVHDHGAESHDSHDHSDCEHDLDHADCDHGHEHEHEHADCDHDHDHADCDHGHEHEHTDCDHHHEDHTISDLQISDDAMITAMLVKFKNPIGLIQIPRKINETTNLQAAVPAFEISRLIGLLGFGVRSVNTIAFIIMIVSGLSIFISLYNSLKRRRYELALMRVHGASKWQLVQLVLQEGLILSFFGTLFGLLISRGALFSISFFINKQSLSSFNFTLLNEELWLFPIALLIGLAASLIPTILSYNINIPKTLSDA